MMSALTAEKDVKLPERAGGVIRAMPERKHSFFWEVFPLCRNANICTARWSLVSALQSSVFD